MKANARDKQAITTEALDLYNHYTHGNMPRRAFPKRLAQIAGGAAGVGMLLPLLEPNYAWGQQVAESDERLETSHIEYPGTGGALEDQEASRDLFGKSDRERITSDIIAGVPYLTAREDCNGRVGAVGFCYGGGVALQCAAREPAIKAAVCFYGNALSAEEVARVKALLVLNYAGEDPRVNEGIPAFRALPDQHGIAYSLHMYPGTGHGFHNDATAARYDQAAAALAWQRTVDFFAHYLGDPQG